MTEPGLPYTGTTGPFDPGKAGEGEGYRPVTQQLRQTEQRFETITHSYLLIYCRSKGLTLLVFCSGSVFIVLFCYLCSLDFALCD